MNTLRPNVTPGSIEAIEARWGLRLTALLDRQAADLPHDVTERLRTSRERALDRARAARRAQARAEAVGVVGPIRPGRAAAGALGGGPSLWVRLASVMPLLLLVAGLLLIQWHQDREQVRAAAEIDTALLADELPPAAYRDPGFAEYLRSGETL